MGTTSAPQRWAEALGGWAIPEAILAAAPESPWGFPASRFARPDEAATATPTRRTALEAVAHGGTVLDIGAGAGWAGLALCPPATRLVAVEPEPGMRTALGERAVEAGVEVEVVAGRWPDVADEVEPADFVVCSHVVYDVADIAPFVTALSDHARGRVVLELTARHPTAWLDPLWLAFHGLERPSEPTADTLVEVLAELGIEADVETWSRPPGPWAGDRRSLVALAPAAASASRRAGTPRSTRRSRASPATAPSSRSGGRAAPRAERGPVPGVGPGAGGPRLFPALPSDPVPDLPSLRSDLSSGLGHLVEVAGGGLAAGLADRCRRRVVALLEGNGDLADWPTSPTLDEVDRACLGLTESLVMDAHSVTDEQVADVERLLGPAGVVSLLVAVSMAEGTARAAAVLA